MRTALLVAAGLLLAACGEHRKPAAPRWHHATDVLAPVPAEQSARVWWHGEDLHAAYVETVRNEAGATLGVRLVVDGEPWKAVPAMPATWGMPGTDVASNFGGPAVFFAPDGTGVAHVAAAEGGVRYVVNGEPGPIHDRVWPLVFRHDGGAHAYLARTGDRTVVVRNGKHHKTVADVRRADWDGWPDLRFAPAGGLFGFIEVQTRDDGSTRARLVLDGKAGAWFPDVRGLRFAPQGRDTLQRVVRDGKVGPPFQEIGPLAYSPDGTRLAYFARGETFAGLVIDNLPQTQGITDIVGAPVWSPDGARCAYVESAEGGWRVVVDGKPGATYERVSALAFHPDGTQPVYIAQRGGTMFPVIGTAEGMPAANTWFPSFDPAGRRHAYRQLHDGATRLVVDGEARPAGARWAGDAVFSPSGSSVAYVIRDGANGQRLLLDGEPGPSFEAIEPLGGRLPLEPAPTTAGLARITGHVTRIPRPADVQHVRFLGDGHVLYVAHHEGRYVVVEARRE